ncbi:phytanoyl-CoA dioxygenase [Colletotrichum tofieldiae]|nr:phytanoyl-CoA dioxygenase [Colletotrichum tofieldiae]GKT76130.1 phytanoyl-CoA dioxygenase [Colletotrichum tofieldiae]GKT87159.1 phytanoyl-CoA dioxygenase [Colletotrichum tofieldiae]
MPRTFNQAGDEAVPICQRCSKAQRYCDRTAPVPEFHNRSHEDVAKTDGTTRYFHHYIVHIAPWYDLSDAAATFATKLPEASLELDLPFSAILALAAVHMSQTSTPSARTAAEFYHGHCVRLLIGLTAEDYGDEGTQGLALASVCLLRSYEILTGHVLTPTEEVDPNIHLQGAYSLAAYRSPLTDDLGSGLGAAGFWNYLREDITFSLFRRCPLKIDLDHVSLPTQHGTDQDRLNTVSLILGRIINACFSSTITNEAWTLLFGMLRDWRSNLPPRFNPFAKADRGIGLALPSIPAALHYELVSTTLLCTRATPGRLPGLRAWLEDRAAAAITKQDMLETLALDVCGVAFTADAPAVQVNAFGPIAFCARFLRAEPARQELVRRLLACKRTIGWPVQRLVADLEAECRGSVARAVGDDE